MPAPRLAARAVILRDNRLLLVNAWPGGQSDLWCAPGGGVERGQSLPDTLIRELHEETGLQIAVGAPCLVNEFQDTSRGFHQVEVFFRCTILGGDLCDSWQDPSNVVDQRRFFSRDEVTGLLLRPQSLPDIAWGDGFAYDPIEDIVK